MAGHADISQLSEVRRPGVADEPVLLPGRLLTVAHQHNPVVDVGVHLHPVVNKNVNNCLQEGILILYYNSILLNTRTLLILYYCTILYSQ